MESLKVVCSNPLKYTQVIQFSRRLVETGVPAGEILTALSCIARAPDLKPIMAHPSAAVAFQLAPDDATRRAWLLEVIEDEGTSSAAVSAACTLLVYVADEESQASLLAFVQHKWPDVRAKDALQALVETGYERLAVWLDGQAGQLDEQNPVRGYFESQKRKIELQKNVPEMLRLINSQELGIDRDWIVRQAIRNGAPRGAVRERVLAHARSARAKGPHRRVFPGMAAAQKCGLFEQEDVEEFAGIRALAESVHTTEFDYSWITLPDKRRREFYCEPRG